MKLRQRAYVRPIIIDCVLADGIHDHVGYGEYEKHTELDLPVANHRGETRSPNARPCQDRLLALLDQCLTGGQILNILVRGPKASVETKFSVRRFVPGLAKVTNRLVLGATSPVFGKYSV